MIMGEETLNKIRRVLLYTAFLLAAFFLSYFVAYPLGYSPLGYEVVEKQENTVVVQSLNTWGFEEKRITYQPPEEEEWRQAALVDRIEGQAMEYHLFFTAIMVAIFWVGMDVMKGKPLGKVLVLSCFYVFFSGLSLIQHLGDINEILEGSFY
ncbi:hypothetical protein GLV98_19500 [Halobacillus litoralis]|uniref:Uncharacterized protein n=1 Tax=Halobacillus litoralis TaxID=45668 RepID=A0A845EKE7_9BACI|nr:hypothetical protein [Halobacillus litoralis]MYL51658.1 hypothetical protein [Halobacillus litoralis]